MVTEHPKVYEFNRKYVTYANLTTTRYGRRDPVYYVGLHFHSLYSFGNNWTVDFYFYQFLSNEYKRSFVEMHFGWCDLIKKDKFFGQAMNQGRFLEQPKCPFAPGYYHLYNMTVPVTSIPWNFPFTKGRIYANVTATGTGEILARGYINMELKPCKHIRMGRHVPND
ncbi:uncharacterized protein LOC106129111 [Amyelois transitella]|uniref:uncharacterized protein LOC106129111 n=1 Tax=Amyelois transitella TaxID=680683 RepID=UPI00298FD484|nr:uncharacterized protein LOC106129111 [Amyelois transitella]